MKQVIEVNDLSELREEEGKLYVCRRYDGGCDGNLWYKGDTTIDRYIELDTKLSDTDYPGIFFAFTDDAMKKGIKSIGFDPDNKESWKGKIFNYRKLAPGLFGTKEGLTNMLDAMDRIRKQIASECDPQEIYIHEYNNHECQYTDDSLAYERVLSIFGEDVAKQIKRF